MPCALGPRHTVIITVTRKDMALSAISMNSALADKEFVLSLHHKLHVSTCINKPKVFIQRRSLIRQNRIRQILPFKLRPLTAHIRM